jgi:hypothetical protein
LTGEIVVQRIDTEPDVNITAGTLGVENPKKPQQTIWTLLVQAPEQTVWGFPEWAEPFIKETPTMHLSPRGLWGSEWTKKSPPNYVERAHALLGRTVDQGRVWDIAATVRYLQESTKEKRTWKVVGRGQTGVLAVYAALFEPSISEVVIVDPPTSHRDGPFFLNVLRVLDIPEALGMLAPRPLTLVNAKDKAFDRTAAIYKAAGAESKLTRK